MRFVAAFTISIILVSCGGQLPPQEETETAYKRIEFYGNAQGTTFSIICNDSLPLESKEIDKILDDFDLMLSGYIDNSMITKLNNAPVGEMKFADDNLYFKRSYELARKVHRITDGAFDPTIHPLWSVWDFNGEGVVPDSSVVDSLMRLIGFQEGRHFSYNPIPDTTGQYSIIKHSPTASLGFDGIAQGVAVDVIAEMLERKGADNYYVEIGGEVRVKGVNSEGDYWRIGIDKPVEDSDATNRELQKIVQVNGRSMATSGSYRKFFEKDGVKYSHTIDPRTGYPVKHSLLSVTVAAETCGMADALATSFMVMGADSTMAFVDANPELKLDVYLIFENARGRIDTYYTRDFRDELIE